MSGIITLLAVALGWFLNELSTGLRHRREDRRAAGPVVMDLLEIRHRLIALNDVKENVFDKLQIPAQVQLYLKQYICTLLPDPPKFAERYEDAVSTLARVDPVQAFRLCGKSGIGPFIAQLSGLAASDQSSSEFWNMVEPGVLMRFMPHLEELILDVARVHGWRPWWRARRRLNEAALDQDDKKFISDLLSKIKASAG